jgi:hypothetical protein
MAFALTQLATVPTHWSIEVDVLVAWSMPGSRVTGDRKVASLTG